MESEGERGSVLFCTKNIILYKFFMYYNESSILSFNNDFRFLNVMCT